MTVPEAHEYTVRGGPWDGELRTFPPVSYGFTSVNWPCKATHEEDARALSTVAPTDGHSHAYVFGKDHPDDLIYSSTRYWTEGSRDALVIPEPAAA